MCSAYVLAAATVFPMLSSSWPPPWASASPTQPTVWTDADIVDLFQTCKNWFRMSESDLNTYKLQLQQVEAALTTDPENEVLLPVDYCKRFIGNAKHVSQFCSTHLALSGTAAAKNRPGAGACSHPRSYKCTAWCLSRYISKQKFSDMRAAWIPIERITCSGYCQVAF